MKVAASELCVLLSLGLLSIPDCCRTVGTSYRSENSCFVCGKGPFFPMEVVWEGKLHFSATFDRADCARKGWGLP